jgi:ElaB/YqjD/DUF883 family membrane-anchored ribosome-binding protein
MSATATKMVNKEVLEPSSQWLSRLPEALTQALDQGKEASRRTWKQARRTAEELSQEALYRVKKYPGRSLGITFGVAAGIGVVAGWYLASRRRPKGLLARWLAR